jgi:hypothetical protein
MTPRELAREQVAAEKRAQFDRERDMVVAWHTAAFTRAEKMPRLETVLIGMRGRRGEAQTYEQMKANLEIISQLNGRPLREVKH